MTKDKVLEVVKIYQRYLLPYLESNSKEEHCYWMLTQIGDMLDADEVEKAMRWLGFVQGCLWYGGHFTIDEMRKHNRED